MLHYHYYTYLLTYTLAHKGLPVPILAANSQPIKGWHINFSVIYTAL